ncbi:MAG: a-factor receptor [Claussenomyces sp. TS43310]|nr:MAG: a-factor receptor [Claussenomyces sp. TS43310]
MDTASHTSAGTIALSVFACLAFLLLIVPFIWHYRNRNVGACTLIFYLNLQNMFTCINAIIWPNENYDSWWIGTGLCDIEVKLQQPLVTGVVCSVACIFRNLANALDTDHAHISLTSASKRRKAFIDIAICCGLPILQIVLHYIIQVNRYYIGAIGGCAASYDNSWPTIVIMYIWPVVLSLMSCYYAVVVITRLYRHRSQFSAILASSGSFTSSRFLRLFIMSSSLLLVYTPVNIYFFYVNVNITWISYDWAAIHDPTLWNIIVFLPVMGARTFDRWVPIAMSIFVFAAFGMGGDALQTYKRWLRAVGLGRVFPSLNQPRRGHALGSSKSTSLVSKMSLIKRARHYLDASAKDSQATISATSTTLDDLQSYKGSMMPTTQHLSPQHATFNSAHASQGLPDVVYSPESAIAHDIAPEPHTCGPRAGSQALAGRGPRSPLLVPLSISSHFGGLFSVLSRSKSSSPRTTFPENHGPSKGPSYFDLEAQRSRTHIETTVCAKHSPNPLSSDGIGQEHIQVETLLSRRVERQDSASRASTNLLEKMRRECHE